MWELLNQNTKGAKIEDLLLQCLKVWWYVGGSGSTVEEFGVRRLLGNSKAHQPTTPVMNTAVVITVIINMILILDPGKFGRKYFEIL